jgi:hypothetical protein
MGVPGARSRQARCCKPLEWRNRLTALSNAIVQYSPSRTKRYAGLGDLRSPAGCRGCTLGIGFTLPMWADQPRCARISCRIGDRRGENTGRRASQTRTPPQHPGRGAAARRDRCARAICHRIPPFLPHRAVAGYTLTTQAGRAKDQKCQSPGRRAGTPEADEVVAHRDTILRREGSGTRARVAAGGAHLDRTGRTLERAGAGRHRGGETRQAAMHPRARECLLAACDRSSLDPVLPAALLSRRDKRRHAVTRPPARRPSSSVRSRLLRPAGVRGAEGRVTM